MAPGLRLIWLECAFSPSFFCLSAPSSSTLMAPLLHFVLPSRPSIALLYRLHSTLSLIWPHFPHRLRLSPTTTNRTPIWVTHHAPMKRRSHRNVTIHLGGRNLWQPVSVGQPGLNPLCERTSVCAFCDSVKCVCVCVCVWKPSCSHLGSAWSLILGIIFYTPIMMGWDD